MTASTATEAASAPGTATAPTATGRPSGPGTATAPTASGRPSGPGTATAPTATGRASGTGVAAASAPGRRWRGAAPAVCALLGSLALAACGGGGGSEDKDGSSPTPSATPSASTPSPAVTGASAELQGSWITTAGGKIVALVITGREAGVFATGGTVCSGTAGAEDGTRMIRLTCADGGKDRTAGTVDSVDGDTLKVTWSGKTGQETYTKAEGGKLPSGLPGFPNE
ncbi:hypothetical protein [Streptomyces sp. NPDC013455]|uniref:hypothetical protein n=1 Tax=Streptomyces sp. NPDC013455 TaxID=3155605 RepID=UPI0033C5A4EE